MELGSHIKEHRTELGLSQDDLAERIYVSRQTISNWECGRTYPDVQSLLLLSNVFGVTVDSLIKGDMETMAQVMNEAVKKYNALSTVTVASAVVFLALSAWAAFQFEWGWGAHIAPTAAFAAVALVVMLVAFVYMERMKKQHDLVTYREVLAFSRGEQVERDTLEGRREREMNPWVKGTRNAAQIVLGAIAGGLVGVGIGMLAKMLSKVDLQTERPFADTIAPIPAPVAEWGRFSLRRPHERNRAHIAHRRSRHRRRMLGGPRLPGRRRPARCGDVRHDGAPLRPPPNHRGRPRHARHGLRANALLVARSARDRLRPPVSPRGRGQPGHRVLWHRLRRNRLRRHGPARQHGQAVSPTTLNQMPIKGRTGPALSIRLTDLRCAYQIFGAPVNHFPFGLSFSGAPKFSKCTEDEMRRALGSQRFKELGAYRANQRGPHIVHTSLQ